MSSATPREHALQLDSQRYPEYERPLGGWLVLAAMAVWTTYVWLRAIRPPRPCP